MSPGANHKLAVFTHRGPVSIGMRENSLFLLLAIIIGMFSGLAVVLFRTAIDYLRIELLGSALEPSGIRLLIVPTLSGFLIAALVIRYLPRVRGSGVNQTKAAVYVFEGYVPFRTVWGKFLTCALAIGSGQSLGPEDPSLQMGAGIASALGRWFRLSRFDGAPTFTGAPRPISPAGSGFKAFRPAVTRRSPGKKWIETSGKTRNSCSPPKAEACRSISGKRRRPRWKSRQYRWAGDEGTRVFDSVSPPWQS